MLAQSTNVFDWDENPVTLSVIELEVLGGRPIARLHQLGASVSADPVGRVYNQFAEMKWRGELCGQLSKCTPLLAISNHANQLLASSSLTKMQVSRRIGKPRAGLAIERRSL